MRCEISELKTFLKHELAHKQGANKQYSQTAFARDLGISSTALSDFFTDKRSLSLKNINKVFKYINSQIVCHWCDKDRKEVRMLVGGPRHQYICNECIDECKNIIRTNRLMI